VKIANGIMMAAEKARTRNDTDSGLFPSESMKKRGQIIKEVEIGEDNRSNHSGIRKFVDAIFTRKSDKDKIISVYARNDWRN
jgi:hypothetical protein